MSQKKFCLKKLQIVTYSREKKKKKQVYKGESLWIRGRERYGQGW